MLASFFLQPLEVRGEDSASRKGGGRTEADPNTLSADQHAPHNREKDLHRWVWRTAWSTSNRTG